jgi:hypothetical protein
MLILHDCTEGLIRERNAKSAVPTLARCSRGSIWWQVNDAAHRKQKSRRLTVIDKNRRMIGTLGSVMSRVHYRGASWAR